MSGLQSTTKVLVIADVLIVQDIHGRYNLNALHRASNTARHKSPSRWLENAETQDLITELDTQSTNSVFDVVKGGNASGVYAHELLAVSYAGWVSPSFQLKVNQAFLDKNRVEHIEVPSLVDPRIQMLTIREAKDLLEDLDCFTERDKLMFADQVRNLMQHGTRLLPAVTGEGAEQYGFSVAERVEQLGYRLTRRQQAGLYIGLGKKIAAEWRTTHEGEEPTREPRWVDGAQRRVAWYPADAAEWIDVIIQSYFAGFPGIARDAIAEG